MFGLCLWTWHLFYNVIYLSFKTHSVLFQAPEKVTLKKNVLGESQLQVCTYVLL